MSNQRIKTQWAAVRITDQQAVIVYTKLKDKPKILFYENPDTFCQALCNNEISAKKWAISLPDELCIKKTIDLPAQSLDEAAQMIEFELASLVPIPVEKIVYGCTPLKQDENVFEIGVYILRKDILDQQLESYHAIGIHPEKVVLDSASVHAAFLNSDSAACILLYIGQATCHILTTLNRDTQDCNCLTNFDMTQGQEHLASELIQRESKLKAYTDDIRIIIAVDNTEQAKTLPQSLKDKGVLSPIMLSSPSAFLPDTATTPFFENLLTASAYEAIYDTRYKYLNLLPAKHLNLIQKKESRKDAIFIAGFSILVLLLIWANFSIWNWRNKRACRQVQALIAPIEHIATDVEQKKLLVRALQGQTSERQKITDVFYELYKHSPTSITISELRYNQKTGIRYLSLKGQTDSLPKAFDYSEAMKKSTVLKHMQINNVQQIPTPGGSIVEFKAECLLQDE